MNKQIFSYRIPQVSIVLLLIALLSSCVSSKDIPYFQDLQLASQANLDSAALFIEPTIQTDDILSIDVFTLDKTTGSIANQAASSSVAGSSATTAVMSQQVPGFLVDRNGEIEMAIMGKIKVAGLTSYQARELVRQRAIKGGFRDPNIQLRFANFKVSVLGEVNQPNTYTMPNEKVTVLDVLALAGDLTIYGRRDNVMVIRESNGKKEMARLNLNSSEIFNSPFYYLKQNDKVYVEPNKRKVSASNSAQIQTIGVITSVISVIVLAIASLK